jgi:hypothetical protein
MSNEEIHDQAIDLITEYRRRLGAHDSEGVQILDEKVREKFFPSLPLALTQESIRKNMQFDKLLGALVFAGNPVAIKRNVLRITTEQEIRAGNNEEDNWPAIEKIMKREEKEVLANYFSESAEDIALGELFSALIAAKNQKEATEVLKTHLNDNQKINEFFMHFYHEYLRYQSFYGDGKAPEEHILESKKFKPLRKARNE